jgi:hypothetical protein
LAWWIAGPEWSGHDEVEAPVRVVSARSVDPTAVVSARIASPSPSIAGTPDMEVLTVNERSELLRSRPRDVAWATPTEAALHAQLADSDVVLQAIRCADMLCSVQGTIASTSTSDRQRIVDQLVRGRLHAAYDRAGSHRCARSASTPMTQALSFSPSISIANSWRRVPSKTPVQTRGIPS